MAAQAVAELSPVLEYEDASVDKRAFGLVFARTPSDLLPQDSSRPSVCLRISSAC